MEWTDDAVRAWQRDHPELELGSLLSLVRLESLARAFEAFERSILAPFELGVSDYRVLAALGRSGRIEAPSPTQLAARLGHTTGGMTKILRRLEGKGLVDRRADPEDGRGTRIALSPRGEAAWERVFRAFAAAAERRLASLPLRRRDELAETLAALTGALEGETRPR